jgi:hypothetical protein
LCGIELHGDGAELHGDGVELRGETLCGVELHGLGAHWIKFCQAAGVAANLRNAASNLHMGAYESSPQTSCKMDRMIDCNLWAPIIRFRLKDIHLPSKSGFLLQ